MTRHRTDLLVGLGLTLLWGLCVAVVGWHGSFPLSDDWAYAMTTRTWLEEGRFERPSWIWSPAVTHTAIGVVFSRALGFSFESLRASGLMFGWLGFLGTYALCRRAGAGAGASALGATTVGLNPLYVNLAFTFMTDVPFAALTTWSLVLFLPAVATLSLGGLAGGGILAALAMASRQIGIALPAAVCVAVAPSLLRSVRVRWLAGFGATLVVLALVVVPGLLSESSDAGGIVTVDFFVQKMLMNPHVAYFALRNSLTHAHYLGLFLLPAAVLAVPPGRTGRALLASSLVGGALGVAALSALDLRMPLAINVIHERGLGPLTLADAGEREPLAAGFWWALTAVAAFGACLTAAILACDAWRRRSQWLTDPSRLLLVAFPLACFAASLTRWPFFDRWLIPLLAPGVACLLSTIQRDAPAGPSAQPSASARGGPSTSAWAVAVTGTVLLASAGIAGTRDYLEHHRARAALTAPLVERGVSPLHVDAGFEYNAWHNFTVDPANFGWVFDDEYRLTHAASLPDYTPVARRRVRLLLPPYEEILTLQRRVPPPAPPALGSSGAPAPAESSDATKAGVP